VTFFVDANVLIYAEMDSEYREPCLEALAAVAAGGADGRISTAALEEVWYFERTRAKGTVGGVTADAYALFTPLLAVTDEAFRHALELDAPHLETNDRVHVGTCLANDIGVILSADRGFDGVKGIRRVDPLDDRARRRLLSLSR
jgi:predicted nucleic acid-binding protein